MRKFHPNKFWQTIRLSCQKKINFDYWFGSLNICYSIHCLPPNLLIQSQKRSSHTVIEKKILISEGGEDHDKALTDAIRKATEKNPDLHVEIRVEREFEN